MTAKVIDIEQNNDAWLKWRLGRIGGSDASIILYESPFKKPYKLWQEKTGIIPVEKAEDEDDYTPFGKRATRHGKDTEHEARMAFAEQSGLILPAACIEQDAVAGLPMSCSLDGYDPDESVALEIKCPKMVYDYIDVAEGRIPDHYYPQIMHNWYCAQTEKFVLVCYFKGPDGPPKMASLELGLKQYDQDYIAAVLIPEERRFWKRVQEKKWPDPVGEKVSDNPELMEYAKLWADFTRQEKQAAKLAARYKAALMRAMDLNGLKRLTVNGVQLTAAKRRGFVNWKKLMEDLGVEPGDDAINEHRNPDSLIHEIVQVKA